MFNVSFRSLNEAMEKLPYARVYQSPIQNDNEFCIEVRHENGGDYDALKNLIKLAEKEGYIYDKYYEMHDIWGDYHYTAHLHVDEGRIQCDFGSVHIYGGN